MKKTIVISMLTLSVLQADLSNSNQVQDQKSEAQRQQDQKSINKSDSKSITKNRGDESSINKSLTKTLTDTRSITKSINKSKNGSWSINLNPVPYVLMQLREHKWDRRAFFLRNSDIGTDYFYDDDEDIIDLNKKAFYEAKSATRGGMKRSQVKKLKEIIEVLDYTGAIADSAISHMNDFNHPDATNIKDLSLFALSKAINEIKPKNIDIYQCNYGGNNNIYVCNHGEYTVALGDAGMPSLIKNGVPYYSAERIGFSTPSLTVSFATSTSEAMSKLIQDSESRAVAQMIREYVSHLQSNGQSEVASKIESAFVEKALTLNVSRTATATVAAINSGSPTAVLKVFH